MLVSGLERKTIVSVQTSDHVHSDDNETSMDPHGKTVNVVVRGQLIEAIHDCESSVVLTWYYPWRAVVFEHWPLIRYVSSSHLWYCDKFCSTRTVSIMSSKGVAVIKKASETSAC